MKSFFRFYLQFFSSLSTFLFDLVKTSQEAISKDGELKARVRTAIAFGFVFLVMLLSGGFLANTLFVSIAIIVYHEFYNIISVNKNTNPELYKKHLILGFIYSVIPFGSLCTINDHKHGYALIFWFFCVIWATDIGAYFTGRHFKGRKLAPSISPGKTISGSLGGVACAFLVGFLMSFIAVNTELASLGIASFGLIAVVISVFAQAGDLLESYIKRYFGIKDSGTILPGHGGMMDRMDSVTFAAPMFLFIVKHLGF